MDAVLAKRLKIIGTGDNRVDVTYVEDAALAHINALDALIEGKAFGKLISFLRVSQLFYGLG